MVHKISKLVTRKYCQVVLTSNWYLYQLEILWTTMSTRFEFLPGVSCQLDFFKNHFCQLPVYPRLDFEYYSIMSRSKCDVKSGMSGTATLDTRWMEYLARSADTAELYWTQKTHTHKRMNRRTNDDTTGLEFRLDSWTGLGLWNGLEMTTGLLTVPLASTNMR